MFHAIAGLLSSFVEVESIKRHFKSRLVGTVLNGYLCLRKLVVQRTKLIDETQDMLLEMLEDMTTGLSTHMKSNHVTHFIVHNNAICISSHNRVLLYHFCLSVIIVHEA